MPVREILAVAFLAAFLLACGPTPDQVNNAGHEPYLKGDYASALASYRDAAGRTPDSGEPYYNSANTLYRTEEYEEALESYDESLIRAEGDLRSRGFFNRGNTSYQRQDYPEAVEAYKEVLRMNPGDEDAKHNLELALLQMPPQDQQEEQEDQQEEEQEADQQEEEMDDQEEDEQERDQEEQEQPITETQARQILESVGEAAQTLQERRGQVLVSPKPPSEYDW